MKAMNVIYGIFALFLAGESAFASCKNYNLEGTYKNGRNDLFRVVQRDCSHMTVIDMQTGNIQVADFDNSRNVLDIGNANSLPAVLARASMMTFSVKKGFDYKPDPNRGSDMMNDVFKDALTIEFTTRPQIKRSYLPEGVNAPLIKFKVILMPWRDGVFEQRGDHTVWTSNPSSKPKSIYIALAGISAVSEPSASLAQKVFNSGVQFGVDLLAKLTLGRFSSPNWDDVDYFAKMAGESLDAAQ